MKSIRITLGIILIALGPLILLTGTSYTLMLPNIYSSVARITVAEQPPKIALADESRAATVTYNPYFLRTQFEMIQSKPVLYEVIKRLDLQREWAGRTGDKLPRDVALKILQNSLSLYQMRDTSMIMISVKRDHPDGAALIANEIAATYRDYRSDACTKEAEELLKVLTQSIEDQQVRVEALRQQGTEQAELKAEQYVLNQLKARQREQLILKEVRQSPVEIIDIAEPDRRPVSPNLFLNVLISGVIALVMAGAGIALLVMGIRTK